MKTTTINIVTIGQLGVEAGMNLVFDYKGVTVEGFVEKIGRTLAGHVYITLNENDMRKEYAVNKMTNVYTF